MRLMKRRIPDETYKELPCILTAVGCAGGDITNRPFIKADGYCSLADANKYIRSMFNVKKRTDFRRGERPTLKELIKGQMITGPTIICVLGHFLYADDDTYWSFFKNGNDDVVTVWELIKE